MAALLPLSPLGERTNAATSSSFPLLSSLPLTAAQATTPKPFRLPLLNAPSHAPASRRPSLTLSYPRSRSSSSSSSSLPPPPPPSFAPLAAIQPMPDASLGFCIDPRSGRALVSPVKPRGGASSAAIAPASPTKGAGERVASPFGKAAPVAARWTERRASGGSGTRGEKRSWVEGAVGRASLATSASLEEDLSIDLDGANGGGGGDPAKRLLPFFSAPALTAGPSSSSNPFDPFLSSLVPTAHPHTHDPPSTDHEREAAEDAEGRSLLSQWTTFSPSPKRDRGRKRARTATLSVVEETQALAVKGRPHANTISLPVEEVQSSNIPRPTTDVFTAPSSSALALTNLPPLPLPLPSPASSLALPLTDGPSSPLRPPGPKRYGSLGTALSSLSLVAEEPAASTSDTPPSEEQRPQEDAREHGPPAGHDEGTNPLAAALAALLSKEKIDLLPAGLVPLLEAAVKEGTAHLSRALDVKAEKGASRLAVLAGLMEKKEEERGEEQPATQPEEEKPAADDGEDEKADVMMAPPPGVGARLQPHVGTASSCSSLSLASTSAASTRSSLRSHRSTPSFSSSTATTPLPTPVATTPSVSAFPPSAPLPHTPHPPYPRNFSRPLRFIYETGESTYEEQRAERTSWLAQQEQDREEEEEEWTSAAGKRRGTGGGGGRGAKKRRSTRGRSVGWADEEEKKEGKGGEEGGEGEDDDAQYVPRPSRSRGTSNVSLASSAPKTEEEDDAEVPPQEVEERAAGRGKAKGKKARRGRA
ncbi:hypothetical protein JCM6882_001285 [Rhodosporidiobolus microsporus]